MPFDRLGRGTAHVNYNMQYKITNKIRVVFHNLRGYDFYFIMQKRGKFKDAESWSINIKIKNYVYTGAAIKCNLYYPDYLQDSPSMYSLAP